jgi:hypothetical protein
VPQALQDKEALAGLCDVAVALLGLLGLIVYAFLTYGVWCANKNAAKAAQDTLRQMESQTRPWVGLDAANHPVRTSQPVIDNDGAARLDCFFNVKNFGNYPAQNTMPICNLVITQSIAPVRKMEKLCASQGLPSFGGAVMFPQGTQSWRWQLVVAKSNMVKDPNSTESTFQAYIVGCIQYRDQFQINRITAFAYRLQPPNSMFGLTFEPTANTRVPKGEWVIWDGLVN